MQYQLLKTEQLLVKAWQAVKEGKGAQETVKAGEIEARDSADRSEMNAEERRNKRPNVGSKGVVLIEDEGVSYSVNVSFSDQVDSVLKGTFNENNLVYMGNTPQRLQSILGLKPLPILVKSSHIYSMSVSKNQAIRENRFNATEHYHNLQDIVKRIPKLLEKPVAIIKAVKSNDIESSKDVAVVIVTSETKKIRIRSLLYYIHHRKDNTGTFKLNRTKWRVFMRRINSLII